MAAEGGLEPLPVLMQRLLRLVSSSLGFLVTGMKLSWGEKMFSLCLEPFIDVSALPLNLLEQSRDVAAPLLQRGAWAGKEVQAGRRIGEGKAE